MKKFLFAFLLLTAACATRIDGRDNSVLESEQDVIAAETDYMTRIRLKKATGPLDQDYILLTGRLARQMVRDPLFSENPDRVQLAVRDVLNYSPSAQIRPAIIHEYVEHALMNTRSVWVVDGSTPYKYILDVELGEITVEGDDTADKKAISAMFVLWNRDGRVEKEWFGFMKRSRGAMTWY